jgi:hypothetical protein
MKYACGNGGGWSWVFRTPVGSNTAQGNIYVRLPLYCVILDNKIGKYVKRKMEKLSHVHCCCGKAVRFTYSECVPLALVFRHAKCMRRIIFSSVAYLLLTYFSTLSHKGQDFWKRCTEHNMCALIFSRNYVWHFSYSEKYSAIYYHNCKILLM